MVVIESKTRFSGMYPDEKVIFFFRHHGMKIFWRILYLFIRWIWIVPLIIIYIMFQESFIATPLGRLMIAIFSFSCLFVIHNLFILILDECLDAIIVTNKRIYHLRKSIFLTEHSDVTKFENIQNITAEKKGLYRNLVGYGSLTFYLYNTIKKIDFVPRPMWQFHRIAKVKEKYKEQLKSETIESLSNRKLKPNK